MKTKRPQTAAEGGRGNGRRASSGSEYGLSAETMGNFESAEVVSRRLATPRGLIGTGTASMHSADVPRAAKVGSAEVFVLDSGVDRANTELDEVGDAVRAAAGELEACLLSGDLREACGACARLGSALVRARDVGVDVEVAYHARRRAVRAALAECGEGSPVLRCCGAWRLLFVLGAHLGCDGEGGEDVKASLLVACRGLFLACRDSSNDEPIQTSGVVSALCECLMACVEEKEWESSVLTPEALVYGCGAAKNASHSAVAAKSLVSCGVVGPLSDLLRRCANSLDCIRRTRRRSHEKDEREEEKEEVNTLSREDSSPESIRSTSKSNIPSSRRLAQLAGQILGALRNLSTDRAHIQAFLKADVIGASLALFPSLIRHRESTASTASMLSRLTLSERCRRSASRETELRKITGLVHALAPTEEAVRYWTSKYEEKLPGIAHIVSFLGEGVPPSSSAPTSKQSATSSSKQSSFLGEGVPPSSSAPTSKQSSFDWRVSAHALCRILFVLGNLTASNARNRAALVRGPVACIEPLWRTLVVFTCILESTLAGPREEEEEDGEGRDRDVQVCGDMLSKGFRFLSNLVLDHDFGAIAAMDARVTVVADVLDRTELASAGRRDTSTRARHPELFLNAAAAAANLGFFGVAGNAAEGSKGLEYMLSRACYRVLPLLLLHGVHDAQLEAARTLANGARVPSVRSMLQDPGSGVLDADIETLAVFLARIRRGQEVDRNLVSVTIGLLINLLSSPSCRTSFSHSLISDPPTISLLAQSDPEKNIPLHGTAILIAILDETYWNDWKDVATMAAKALYNFLQPATDAIPDESPISSSPTSSPKKDPSPTISTDEALSLLQILDDIVQQEHKSPSPSDALEPAEKLTELVQLLIDYDLLSE